MTETKYPSLAEIRAQHAPKVEYERFLFASRYVFRPPSFPAIWLLVRLGITGEGASWLSGLAALCAYACLLLPAEPMLWAGFLLLCLFNFFDCLDGGIARALKARNPYGRFLDSIMGWADMLFWGVIGVTVWRLPELRLAADALGIPAGTWLAAGAFAAFLSTYVAYLDASFDSALNKYWQELQSEKGVTFSATPVAGKSLPEAAARVLVHNLRVRETHYLLLPPAFALGLADALLAFFLVFYALLAAALLFAYCRRGLAVKAAGLGGEKK